MKKAYLFCIYHNSFEDCLKRTRMSKTCSCHLKASRKTISGIAHSSESMRSGWWGRSKNVSPELMNPKRWKKCCTTLGQGMSCTALRWITLTWVQYDLFKNIFFFISSFLLITSYLPCNNMTVLSPFDLAELNWLIIYRYTWRLVSLVILETRSTIISTHPLRRISRF